MTVRELGERMDSAELSEWMAYQRIEPLPDPFWIGGVIASTMANIHTEKKFKPEDFMPKRTAPPQSAAEGIARARAYIALFNAARPKPEG